MSTAKLVKTKASDLLYTMLQTMRRKQPSSC